MSSSKFYTLIGLVIAIFAICNINPVETSESFGMLPSMATKVIREVHPGKGGNGSGYSLQNNYQAMLGSSKFVSNPSYQSLLSPRFFNSQYGANIKYNPPSHENTAVPYEPMTFGNMVRENYNSDGGVTKCGKGGIPLSRDNGGVAVPPAFHTGNYNEVAAKVYTGGLPDPTSLASVGDMTTVNSDGSLDQTVVYDRYIYAMQKSRLRSHGDPIRGDLPIVPCNNGWFNVSATPNIDLMEGAMNVMGGVGNGTTLALSDLMYATSGGSQKIVAGVDLTSSDLSNQFASFASQGGRSVNISSFP